MEKFVQKSQVPFKRRIPSKMIGNKFLPPRKIIPQQKLGSSEKNISQLDTEKKKKVEWDLKDAGNAILIAGGLMIIQVLFMLLFNLRLLGSFILGFFLIVIFVVILYSFLEPKIIIFKKIQHSSISQPSK